MIHFFKSLYLNTRLFILLAISVLLFIIAYFFPLLLIVAKIFLIVIATFFVCDLLLLYRLPKGIKATRNTPEKLSNGDQNRILLKLESEYNFETNIQLIDELPFQFQKRDVLLKEHLMPKIPKKIIYELRPTERGVYHFGALNIYAQSPLSLAIKRYKFSINKEVPVYPSFIQMRKYELMAISNRLQNYGIKKLRRIGHSMEFEQIKEYVVGDDYRTVNWKATARKGAIMVNQYQDERSQQVFNLIDKGRVMKMPFEGLSLLDYAINTSLVIANVAIKKGDKTGLITFAEKMQTLLPASNRSKQLFNIQELLYKEKTNFLESDYQQLYATIRRQVNQRSLLLLYSNFETLPALKRQLPYLRAIAKRHLLVVIFFKNTELQQILDQKAKDVERIYQKTIAEKFNFEKKQIVKELQKYGIQSILTAPQKLTIDTINKYLELKSRGFI